MRQRDYFIAGTRLIGVYVLLLALADFRAAVIIKSDWIGEQQASPIQAYVFAMMMEAVVGIYLLFFAHQLAGLIYRNSSSSDAAQK